MSYVLIDGVKISEAEYELKYNNLKSLVEKGITKTPELNTITKEELLELVLQLPDNSQIVFGNGRKNSNVKTINYASEVKIKFSKFHDDWYIQDFDTECEESKRVVILLEE